MPPTSSHIPLPNRGSSRSSYSAAEPAFGTPVRISLALLAWAAFGVAGYLAWHAVSATSVAGCGVGASNGCDVVLSSSWSRWLGVPVAVLGLACYTALASLSVLLWLRSEAAGHWIATAFVMLSIVAAGASLWFIGVQVFAIHDYCKFCLVTDVFGIILGSVAVAATVKALWSTRGASQSRSLPPAIMGTRPAAAVPGVRTTAVAVATAASPPSLAFAFGGAVPLLALLIGGQLLFASKTYQVEQVALGDAIKFDNSGNGKPVEESSTATTRVAMRVPSEGEEELPSDSAARSGDPAATDATTATDDAPTASAAPASPPAHERMVKFLGGKLELDVSKHPLIGSPDAPHVVIEMVSYNCPHCRKMHALVEDAVHRYGDQVAVLVMPVPLDKDCNKLITDAAISHRGACGTARMVISVAKLNPSAFPKLHDFLMSGDKDKPPAMERLIPKAQGLVDRDRLRELMKSAEVNKQLAGYVDLFGQLQSQSHGSKAFGLPVQILGDKVMSGEVEKAEDIYKAWEENLGVKPK